MFKNTYKGKKVLVTGNTGFKGSWLSLWLKDLGAEVYGISKSIPTEPSHFEVTKLDNEMSHSPIDIKDFNPLVEKIKEIKPDIVFHLAAEAIVRTCYDDPRNAFETNAIGTINLLECVRQVPSIKAAVFITSDKCYENVEWEFGYRENDRVGGKDPYSASKACAEIAFSSYSRSFFNEASSPHIATARAGNVIGGGDWGRDRLVPDAMKAWAENKKIELRNPYSTRPWQHVLEPLSGYLQLGANLFNQSENLKGESFNFGPKGDSNYDVLSLVHTMQKYWKNTEYEIRENQFKNKKEANLLKLCCDKAQNRLNWVPVLSLEETLEMTVNWYRNFYITKKSDPVFIHHEANISLSTSR